MGEDEIVVELQGRLPGSGRGKCEGFSQVSIVMGVPTAGCSF